nr:hypothetical protein [Clostridia bacterium]
MNLTFSALLRQILEERNINLSKLFRELFDLGMDLTYASLYSYYIGKTAPPFEVAKKIITLENLNIENDDIEKILEYSRKISKSENEEKEKILNLNLKIKPTSISKAYKNSANELRSLIEMRAKELFGDEDMVTQFSAPGRRKISAYMAYLIKKDLEENEYIERIDE